jgi:hypothetical protein
MPNMNGVVIGAKIKLMAMTVFSASEILSFLHIVACVIEPATNK